VIPVPGDDAPGGGAPRAADRLAEVKAVRAEAAALWPDTGERLARLQAALEAQQERQDGESG